MIQSPAISTPVILKPRFDKRYNLPFHSSLVSAGFPSPADDSLENPLDITELLIANPNSTYYVRVQGDSMINAGIFEGDILVVDRGQTPKKDDVIVALYNGEFTVKRFTKIRSGYYLVPENPNYQPLRITAESGFEIWGVVRFVIHDPAKRK